MTTHSKGNAREVFRVFLQLGLTSFGGPVAHLGYFREAIVKRLAWLDDQAYADLVALGQFLPGPASSQVGLAIGWHRAGLAGAMAAWLGFTLPSAILMVLFAYGVMVLDAELMAGGWLQGLKAVAVAVVAQALWSMARNLCPDRNRASVALAAAILILAWPTALTQVGAILLGGLLGWGWFQSDTDSAEPIVTTGKTATAPALICLGVFFALLLTLPLVATWSHDPVLQRLDSFYRSGALVFGGGHVILPLLQAQVVEPGWIDGQLFLAGYGAAQALPGPLFTFAAFLGTSLQTPPNGLSGAILCLLAIFLPSVLLVFGALPFWNRLRQLSAARSALTGINAAVVGVLIAAFYDPILTGGITSGHTAMVALGAWGLLVLWQLPPWLVVILGALAGELLC